MKTRIRLPLPLPRRLRAFGRTEDGVASVEFVLIFPLIFFMFIWAIELGIIMTKQVMLEFAVDVTMRELRLGRLVNPDSDMLKDTICDRVRILGDCRTSIMLDMQPVNTATWALPVRSATCRDREQTIQPVVSFQIGQQNEIMLIRACVIVDPLFPGTGIGAMLPRDPQGGFGMVAMSAFVNEPS